MKKILTGLAGLAVVAVGGLALASCGGESIVNTAGNYKEATYYEEVVPVTTDYTPSAGGYEFRIVIDASLNEDVDITGVGLEEGTARFNYSGTIDSAGNIYLTGSVFFKGGFQGLTMSYNAKGSVYFDGTTDTVYSDVNGEKIKYTDASDSIFTSIFANFAEAIDSNSVVSAYFNDADATYKMATSDSYIKLNVSLADPDAEVKNEGSVYLILDADKNFKEFRMDANVQGMSQIIEFVASEKTVEMPEDLESYQDYASIGG